MTIPTTRLAEIAERQAFEAAFPTAAYCWSPTLSQYTNDWHQAKWSGWLARFTAAQARSREDAEIMREAANVIQNGCNTNSPCLTPDCTITKLRARADEMGGRTDG